MLELGHLLDDRLGADGIAQSPSGHAIGLGITAQEDQILRIVRRRWATLFVTACWTLDFFVAELVIDFVGEDQQVVFLCQGNHVLTGLIRGHHTGGIAGCVKEDEFGFVCDVRFKLIR